MLIFKPILYYQNNFDLNRNYYFFVDKNTLVPLFWSNFTQIYLASEMMYEFSVLIL